MRTWRVGTISMGLTLILLGIFLVLSQLLNWKPAYAMTGWWPIIFIVLGIEILIYLFLAKQEDPAVKYDVFSIFFVGFLGFVGIGFATVQATGMLDHVHKWATMEMKTLDLPTYETKLDDKIKRIVVNTGLNPLTIETGTSSEISVFGTYVTEVVDGKAPIEAVEDYLFTEIKGDTLFITLKQMPEMLHRFSYHHERNATMIVPDHVKVDIKANDQPLYVNSRSMKNDWTIENAAEVNIQLASDLDVKLNAENIDDMNEHDGWKIVGGAEDEEHHFQSGTRQFGKGTYVMTILNASNVTVMTKE